MVGDRGRRLYLFVFVFIGRVYGLLAFHVGFWGYWRVGDEFVVLSLFGCFGALVQGEEGGGYWYRFYRWCIWRNLVALDVSTIPSYSRFILSNTL